MQIPATSRQYVIVPAVLLDAQPPGQVDLALMPDDGTEPAEADWIALSWLYAPDGSLLGAGLLAGPGATVIPAGDYLTWYREHRGDGELPVQSWTRLQVGP